MVYMIEGDIILLSQTALKDLKHWESPIMGPSGGDLQAEELDDDKVDDKGDEKGDDKRDVNGRQPLGECDPESNLPCSCP